MPLPAPVLAVGCTLAIATGQMFFKTAAMQIESHGTVFHPQVITTVGISLTIYGLATLAWIYVLRLAPLSAIYPYMALSFVIVPALSFFFFNEPISKSYIIGLSMIIGGILVITRSA